MSLSKSVKSSFLRMISSFSYCRMLGYLEVNTQPVGSVEYRHKMSVELHHKFSWIRKKDLELKGA